VEGKTTNSYAALQLFDLLINDSIKKTREGLTLMLWETLHIAIVTVSS
jgi:hypothetical protein